MRSVPEWIASERSPRLFVAMPATSLTAISTAAAMIEPSAVRRCGVMRGSIPERRRARRSGLFALARSSLGYVFAMSPIKISWTPSVPRSTQWW